MRSTAARILFVLGLATGSSACSFEVPPELSGDEVADMPSSSPPDSFGDLARREMGNPPVLDMMAMPLPDLEFDQSVPLPDMPAPIEDMRMPDMPDMPIMPDQGVDQGMGGPIYQICDGTRVDITTNPAHCGGCDQPCEGGCVDGACSCPWSGGEVCGEDGQCRDTLYDPRNCGGCDVLCEAGEVCNAGQCTCRPGLTRCGDACVDTTLDPRHCGECGRDCGESNRCKASQCGESQLCGLGYTGCRRDNRVACVKDNVERENDLYCRPGPRFDILCGQRCSGNEVCFEPEDLLNPIQCRPYRPVRECDQCPCASCRADEVCRRQILGVEDVTYCVRKP